MELAKYAMVIVATKRDRHRCFETGLRSEIWTIVITFATRCSYVELVEVALCVHDKMEEGDDIHI